MKCRDIIIIVLSVLLVVLAFTACQTKTPKVKVSIKSLEKPVLVNDPVIFTINESIPASTRLIWELGDSTLLTGKSIKYTFNEPGIFFIKLYVEVNGTKEQQSSILVRAHTPETVSLPQVILDTDARNEVDDQNYITYALYSGIDVLGVNSIHNGEAFSESVNYGEIYYVFRKLRYSDFSKNTPLVFHGAQKKLQRPVSGNWTDTQPIVTEASTAIIAAARGASPDNPVYVIPVGPCTNIASAILQARRDNFDLNARIRVLWLGGGPEYASKETYNGKNDPWSVYVMAQSGIDFTIILENPTSAKLKFHRDADANRYPQNEIGHFLRSDILERMDLYGSESKSLYDLTTISTVISNYLNLNWLTIIEDVSVGNDYKWLPAKGKTNVHVVREINTEAMKNNFFKTINNKPTDLIK